MVWREVFRAAWLSMGNFLSDPLGARNGAADEVWDHAIDEKTLAATARLAQTAMLAAVVSQSRTVTQGSHDGQGTQEARRRARFSVPLLAMARLPRPATPRMCRFAYSSVLNATSMAHAEHLLSEVLVVSLRDNPARRVGGILYFDDESYSIVQVLEGPTFVVRALFYDRIHHDRRHTAVKKLWEMEISQRRYEGFGMKLGDELVTAAAPDGIAPAAEVLELASSRRPRKMSSTSPPQAPPPPPLLRLTYTSHLLAKGDVCCIHRGSHPPCMCAYPVCDMHPPPVCACID